MSMSDPLGDMLTRIRNAQRAKKSEVVSPASRLRENVSFLQISHQPSKFFLIQYQFEACHASRFQPSVREFVFTGFELDGQVFVFTHHQFGCIVCTHVVILSYCFVFEINV